VSFVFVIAFLCAVLGGATYYVARKIYLGMLSLSLPTNLWAVIAVVSFLTLVMILGFAQSMLPFHAVLKHILSTVAFCWMGIFIYILLYSILADAVWLVLKLFKSGLVAHRLYSGISLVAVLFLALSTSVYGFCNARCIKNADYTVSMVGGERISDGSIVMISDLHLGSLGSESRLDDIVARINSQSPDLICISGDFFDTDFESIKDVEGAKAKLKRLSATYGVYACLGNHDAGKTLPQMKSFLEDCNITLLNEDHRIIDGRFALVGRADASPIGGYGEEKRGKLSSFFEAPEGMPVIVMDHNPARLDEYKGEEYLILSGHTHKGQLFPASIVTGLMYEVDYGYYQKGDGGPQIIVSSGIGYWGMPMKVGSDSEIVSVTFKGK
jgi:predicted MPP superfamily phosphohydrolase